MVTAKTPYVLGHSTAELNRLRMQADVLRPITRRLLIEAGLRPGDRVLDLGSGMGDVSLLAAELVGPDGMVAGIDRSAAAVAAARDRAASIDARNVDFRQAEAQSFRGSEPFDLVVGRYVLIHQDDPENMIRAAADCARSGGVVAFHEVALHGNCMTLPPAPSVTEMWDALISAFTSVLAHPDVASRMVEYFQRANLGVPSVFCEIPIGGGPNSPPLPVARRDLAKRSGRARSNRRFHSRRPGWAGRANDARSYGRPQSGHGASAVLRVGSGVNISEAVTRVLTRRLR